jgi:hypothetical protein
MNDALFCQKRIFEQYRYDAKSRHLAFEIPFDHFIKYLQEACYYCGDKETCTYTDPRNKTRKFKYNGIDRFDNAIGYIEGNLVPCCGLCNWMKKGLTFDDFLIHLYKIFHNRINSLFNAQNRKGGN